MKPANDASVDLGPEFAALPKAKQDRARMLMATKVGYRRGGRVCVMIRRDVGEIGSVSAADALKGHFAPTMRESVEDWWKRKP